MKHHLAALAVSSLLMAIPGQAFAVVWHCVAYPGGLQSDQHHGYGYTQWDAGQAAKWNCEASHTAGTCVIDWSLCHIDH